MSDTTKKIIDSFNELQTEESLIELCEHIDKNGWVHLYSRIDYVDHLEHRIEELKDLIAKSEATKEAIETAINAVDKIHSQLMKTAGI